MRTSSRTPSSHRPRAPPPRSGCSYPSALALPSATVSSPPPVVLFLTLPRTPSPSTPPCKNTSTKVSSTSSRYTPTRIPCNTAHAMCSGSDAELRGLMTPLPQTPDDQVTIAGPSSAHRRISYNVAGHPRRLFPSLDNQTGGLSGFPTHCYCNCTRSCGR